MSAIFGEVLKFGQARGPEVSLRVYGDEHYARYEDLNGFSVIYDDQLGLFCYARLAAGSFRSTGTPITENPPAGLVRHLQEVHEVVSAKASARKRRRAAMAGDATKRPSCAHSVPIRGCLRVACCRSAPSRA